MPETQEQINERMAKVREAKKAAAGVVDSLALLGNEARNAHKEGESVDLGDAGVNVYKDRSGGRLGGGPSEGVSYAAHVAKEAERSIREHLEREAKAEKEKGAQ